MNYFSVFSLSVVLITSGAALAQDSYQFELSADYRDSDGGNYETTEYTLMGTYYLAPVETRNHPYAEAAFMERASSASLGFSMGKTEWKFTIFGTDTFEFIEDSDSVWASINVAQPNQAFTFSADYARSNDKSRSDDDESEYTTYRLAVGAYVAQYSHINLGVWRLESENNSDTEYKDDILHLEIKHVEPLDQRQAVAVEGSFFTNELIGDKDYEYSFVQGTYYPMQKLGFGAILSYLRSDEFNKYDESELAMLVEYFFTPALALRTDYSKTLSSDDEDKDDKTWRLGFRARF